MKQCLVCFFLCLTKCGCRNWLVRKFAFFPPKPPTYNIITRKDNQKYEILNDVLEKQQDQSRDNSLKIYRISSEITHKDVRPYKTDLPNTGDDLYSFDTPQPNINQQIQQQPKTKMNLDFKLINPRGEAIEIAAIEGIKISSYFTQTKTQNTIPLVLIQPTNQSNYVIIYSHPNSADLGLMFDNYLDLAYNLKINILAYDYTGFGQSTGIASDINALADLEAVYNFAIKELGFTWNNIILYGQSIGSGPSVTIAANSRYPVAGLIIHSGLASGLRIFKPELKNTPYNDIFPNQDYLKYVNCLVYIFHGSNDQQISVHQAEELSRSVRNLYCVWFIKEAGHNNIEFESRFRFQYFQKLRFFVKEVQSRNQFYRSEELLKLYRAHKWNDLNHLYNDYFNNSDNESQCKSIKTQSGRPPTFNSRTDTTDIELPQIFIYNEASPSQGKKRRQTEISTDQFLDSIKQTCVSSPRKSVQIKTSSQN